MSFTPEGLHAALERTLQGVAWPPDGYCVALSGGLDSTVLLDVSRSARRMIEAGFPIVTIDGCIMGGTGPATAAGGWFR